VNDTHLTLNLNSVLKPVPQVILSDSWY